MCLKSVLVSLVLAATAVECIFRGQKYSIQRVPFIVHGEATARGYYMKFSGVILNENMIMTTSPVDDHMYDFKVTVGTANVGSGLGQIYYLGNFKKFRDLTIFEVTNRPIRFGESVQKATLSRHFTVLPFQVLNLAGWGTNNFYNVFPTELHFRRGFLRGEAYKPTDLSFRIYGKEKDDFWVGEGNYGCPVWNPATGEVMGLGLTQHEGGSHQEYYAASIYPLIDWVDEVIELFDDWKTTGNKTSSTSVTGSHTTTTGRSTKTTKTTKKTTTKTTIKTTTPTTTTDSDDEEDR